MRDAVLLNAAAALVASDAAAGAVDLGSDVTELLRVALPQAAEAVDSGAAAAALDSWVETSQRLR